MTSPTTSTDQPREPGQGEGEELPSPEAPQLAKSSSGTFLVIGLLLFFTLILSSLVSWSLFFTKPIQLRKYGSSKLSIMGTVPDFELVERGGEKVSLNDLRGKVWVASFIFTHCAGTCPIMSANMAHLQEAFSKIPAQAVPVKFVSVTVDPERDTPEVLNDYADNFRADKKDWLFLRGPFDQIQMLAQKGFKLGVTPGDPDSPEPIIHSQSFALVDTQGRIRGYYDGTNASEVKKMFADIQNLVIEGKGE